MPCTTASTMICSNDMAAPLPPLVQRAGRFYTEAYARAIHFAMCRS